MHENAMNSARRFFQAYGLQRTGLTIVDVGAQDVNGSLREVAPAGCTYVGLDFVEGPGVDIIISDPYALPLAADSADIVVCSSCFEHSEFFWLLFNEIMRVLKPDGLLYLNVPSNGDFHRHPVDCWRFYPDSGHALQNWARRSGYSTVLLESFVSRQKQSAWNDLVAVFLKDTRHADRYQKRIQDGFDAYRNGWTLGSTEFSKPTHLTEDHELHPLRNIGRALRRSLQRIFDALPATLQRQISAMLHPSSPRKR